MEPSGRNRSQPVLVRHRLHDDLAALLLEAHRAALEVDVPLADLRGGAAAGPEVGQDCDREQFLPVLLRIQR